MDRIDKSISRVSMLTRDKYVVIRVRT